MLCSEARVDSSRMRNGKLHESDWPKVVNAIGKLGEAPLFIDDNPNLTVMEIRAKARRLKSREGLGLIVVDYLQLMSGHGPSESRQVEVSEISRGLKNPGPGAVRSRRGAFSTFPQPRGPSR